MLTVNLIFFPGCALSEKELKITEGQDGRQMIDNDFFKQVHDKIKEAGIDISIEQIINSKD